MLKGKMLETAVVSAETCQYQCALEFNVCKFAATKAQTVCSSENETCRSSCPIVPVPPDESETKTNPDPSGGILKGGTPPMDLTCLPDILQPVQPRTTYLILTRSLFVDALQPFVDAKRRAGETVNTVLIEQIACSEPGADIPEKIRNYLRRQSEASTVMKRPVYALLVGAPRRLSDIQNLSQIRSYGQKLKEPWEVPMRYIYPLSGDLQPIPTDQYYASVLVDWDTTLAPFYRDLMLPPGGFLVDQGDHWATNFNFATQFSLGRVPVRTPAELTEWIGKTLAWRTPEVFVESTFQTSLCQVRRPHYSQPWEDAATHRVVPNVCLTDNGGDISTYANRQMPDLVSSYSHGVYDSVISSPFTNGYRFSTSSPGFIKSPILFVHGCEVGGIDFPGTSLAEAMIGRRDGVVAFVGSTRSHWDSRFPFQDSIFHKGRLTLGSAFYGAKEDLVRENHLSHRLIDNLFMYTLYGDPALQIVNPSVKITAPPVVLVPAAERNEEFSLSVRIQSFLTDRLLSGTLYLKNFLGEEVRVPAVSTVRATLRSPIIEPSYPVTASLAETLGFFTPKPIIFSSRSPVSLREPLGVHSGCDTTRMTCISPEITISPPLQLACGRMDRVFGFVDGARRQVARRAEVKVLRENAAFYSGPVTFSLKMRPRGYFATFDEYLDQALVDVARLTVSPPSAGQVFAFDFGVIPTGERNTGLRPDLTFADATYEVEARDATNRVIGYCYYLFEPAIEPNY